MLILSLYALNQFLNLYPLAQSHQNLTAQIEQQQQSVVGLAILVKKDLLDHLSVFGDELGD